MLSRDYRSTARGALRGHWGTSILVAVAAVLLGANGNPLMSASSSTASSSNTSSGMSTQEAWSQMEAVPPFIIGIAIAILSAAVIYALVTLILGGAVKLGLVNYNIDLITKRNAPAFSTLFSRFSIFGKAFLLHFMINLFISLWTILLVIPGIVASYRYAMAPYLLAENPELGVMEAISLSKQMMKGNKWRLFKLYFSFFGWCILGVLTFCIGFLWITPYVYASEAAFFLDVSGKGAQNAGSFTGSPDMV